MAADWSTVFRRSSAHPAVFAVREASTSARLMAWAHETGLAHRHQRYAFAAELDGWAMLDGGLSYLEAHASGRLRSGLRVVGWATLRLLADELALEPPRRLLVGEPARSPAALLRRLTGRGWVSLGSPSRQARMLVSYVDARGLAEIAGRLVQAGAGVTGAVGAQPDRLRRAQ
jgi:hypothetical protein